jgi:molybdenum cofactor synthesis domain-containing protein
MMPAEGDRVLMATDARQGKGGRDRRRPSARPAPKVRPRRGGPVRVEVISVGREMLRGKIPDGNAQRVARLVTQRGAMIRRITVVDDTAASISTALRESLERDPHLVVTTGGLGPAEDDRTLEGASMALARPLTLDHATKSMVESAYRRLKEKRVVRAGGLTAAREKLCMIPLGSTPVPNPLGVSPGVFIRLPGGAIVLCLPGMPEEMQAVLEAALPQLKINFAGEVALREIEAPTSDESELAPLLDRLGHEFPGVWISSRPAGSRKTGGKIVIRVEATGASRSDADAVVDGCVRRLLALVAGGL